MKTEVPSNNPSPPGVETLGKVGAVVVTYNCGAGYRPCFEATLPQVSRVFLVDNGSDAPTRETIESLRGAHPERVEILYNPRNIGLAAAQNQGIRRALEEGCDWVLLLDHDSVPDAVMLTALGAAYATLSSPENVGLLAPRVQDIHSRKEPRYPQRWLGVGFRRRRFGNAPYVDNVLCVIASGSLLRAEALRSAGWMREDFFIDYIDAEYCLRLISKGWRIVAVKGAILRHSLGQQQDHTLLGAHIVTTNHSPARRYTIFRNRVRVWRQYLFKIPSYVAFDAAACAYDILRIILFEKDKIQKFYHAMRGFAGLPPPEKDKAA